MLIKATEYAERHGYKPATVSFWCRKGILPQARKMFTGRRGVASYIYMIPEDAKPIREKRAYRKKLAEEYKGVAPQVCQTCESPCMPGRDLLKILGMERERPKMIADVFEPVHHARGRMHQKVIKAMNRRNK